MQPHARSDSHSLSGPPSARLKEVFTRSAAAPEHAEEGDLDVDAARGRAQDETPQDNHGPRKVARGLFAQGPRIVEIGVRVQGVQKGSDLESLVLLDSKEALIFRALADAGEAPSRNGTQGCSIHGKGHWGVAACRHVCLAAVHSQ